MDIQNFVDLPVLFWPYYFN